MDRKYLQEAFQAMELLEAEDFSLDTQSVKDILDFQEKDELSDIIDVIDPEAETEDEIKDSYIGSVILECEVCHSPIFKNVEDVIVDEDSDLANIEDECPICHSQDGFKIIGQVAPYQEEAEIKVEVEDKSECEDGECKETEDEKVEEEYCEKCGKEVDESLNESVELRTDTEPVDLVKNDDGTLSLEIGNGVASVTEIDEPIEAVEEPASTEEIADAVDSEETAEAVDELEAEEEKVEESLKEELDPELEDKLEEIEDAVEKVAETVEEVAEEVCPECEEKEAEAIDELECEDGECEEVDEALEEAAEDIADAKEPEDFIKKADEWSKEVGDGSEVEKTDTKGLVDEACCKEDFDAEKGEFTHDTTWDDIMKAAEVLAKAGRISDEQKKEILGEELNEARTASLYDLITKELYSAATGEHGGVDGKGHKIMADKEERYANEQIVPGPDGIRVVAETPEDLDFAKKVADYFKAAVSDVKELSANKALKVGKFYRDIAVDESLTEGFEKIDLEMDDKIIHVSEEEKEPIPDAEMITPVSDELESEIMNPIEEPIEVENNEEELAGEEMPEEDIDYDIDDFEEEDFNDLGESYLKEVYENVESFKTSQVSLKEDKLVVEGIIKFNSGKEKATQFIFEAKDATKSGKVRFIGENAQITRGKKAFTLSGRMQENKFIAESLNYNYRAKDVDGKSTRLYGTINR